MWVAQSDHQMQFLSSQHMKVLKEQPWHRLQLEHIRPSAQLPYLGETALIFHQRAPETANIVTFSQNDHTTLFTGWSHFFLLKVKVKHFLSLLPGELAATHLAWPLEADGVPTGVFRGAVCAGGGSWQGSGAGGGQGVTCCQPHQHHHHHPRHQGHTGAHLGGRTVCDVCSLYCQIWTRTGGNQGSRHRENCSYHVTGCRGAWLVSTGR